MILRVDAQLPPQLATWIEKTFQVEAFAARDLGLREAKDSKIFEAARQAGAVVMTKDKDFIDLLNRWGPPPQIIWITIGNTSNARLQETLELHFKHVRRLLGKNEPLVEIRDRSSNG